MRRSPVPHGARRRATGKHTLYMLSRPHAGTRDRADAAPARQCTCAPRAPRRFATHVRTKVRHGGSPGAAPSERECVDVAARRRRVEAADPIPERARRRRDRERGTQRAPLNRVAREPSAYCSTLAARSGRRNPSRRRRDGNTPEVRDTRHTVLSTKVRHLAHLAPPPRLHPSHRSRNHPVERGD
jgi:hypothetical protein